MHPSFSCRSGSLRKMPLCPPKQSLITSAMHVFSFRISLPLRLSTATETLAHLSIPGLSVAIFQLGITSLERIRCTTDRMDKRSMANLPAPRRASRRQIGRLFSGRGRAVQGRNSGAETVCLLATRFNRFRSSAPNAARGEFCRH